MPPESLSKLEAMFHDIINQDVGYWLENYEALSEILDAVEVFYTDMVFNFKLRMMEAATYFEAIDD